MTFSFFGWNVSVIVPETETTDAKGLLEILLGQVGLFQSVPSLIPNIPTPLAVVGTLPSPPPLWHLSAHSPSSEVACSFTLMSAISGLPVDFWLPQSIASVVCKYAENKTLLTTLSYHQTCEPVWLFWCSQCFSKKLCKEIEGRKEIEKQAYSPSRETSLISWTKTRDFMSTFTLSINVILFHVHVRSNILSKTIYHLTVRWYIQ